jgi:hypothetical protein
MPSRRERVASLVASVVLCSCLACSLSLIARDFAKPLQSPKRFDMSETVQSRYAKPYFETAEERTARKPPSPIVRVPQSKLKTVESYFSTPWLPSNVRSIIASYADIERDARTRRSNHHVCFSVLVLFGVSAFILALIAGVGSLLSYRSGHSMRLLPARTGDVEGKSLSPRLSSISSSGQADKADNQGITLELTDDSEERKEEELTLLRSS